MGYLRFNFRSEALGKFIDISIVFPTDIYSYYDTTKEVRHHLSPGQKLKPPYQSGMKFQTVYLIHGGGDDDSLTYRYTNAERYAQRNNVMLVTPDIANSFGADTNYGVEYFTFLTEELPVVIQTLFASSPKREDNFIMGYAMGGNVALACAIKCPEKYSVCIDMSGGIGYTVNTETLKAELDSDHFRKSFSLYNFTFGESSELDNSRHDLYQIAKQKIDGGEQLSKFYLVAGSEEGFIGERVKADAETLTKLGYDVTYKCIEGYWHDFTLWDMYIKLALDQILPLKRDPSSK
jgi:putative tributyrin esterase